MKKIVLPLIILFFGIFNTVQADTPTQGNEIYLEIGKDIHSFLKSKFSDRFVELEKSKEKILVQTDMEVLPWVSMLVHREFKQCGGYFTYFEKDNAVKSFKKRNPEAVDLSIFEPGFYALNQAQTVKQLISGVRELNIREVITELSSFHNRYYQAQSGVDSQTFLKNRWEDILRTRSDANVKFFNHARWKQPSVIAEIKGAVKPDEYIVIGGHADSIAGFWGRSTARAPGADDNASGIATITEIMRVLVENNFMPDRTILFMGYAAEEVGLLGSKEIAQDYKRSGKNVIGVVQLDMTNFNGSNEDIVLITDNTNNSQNQFMAKILDTYLPNLSWTNDRCGYACSDHASWDAQGFPASMPFEAKKGNMNRNIHTKNDTISKSGGTANHAVKFAKLTLAFIAELDK